MIRLLILAAVFALIAWRLRPRPRTTIYPAWAEDWNDPAMDVYNTPTYAGGSG